MTPHLAWILATRLLPESSKVFDAGLRIAVIVALAFLAQRLLFALVARLERLVVRAGPGGPPSESRARTVGGILRSLCTVSVAGFALIHVFVALGVDIRPLLAGAGIVGVALGFGAQTVVRDVIAGVFILAENQFGVGDLIEVGGRAATVESITVRSTRLRDFNGYVHFVPNGEMKIVTNRSRGWNRLAVDIVVPADQDLERALEVCRKVVGIMNADPLWKERLLDPIELWGVEAQGGNEVSLRMVVRAEPGPDVPEAARELRRRAHRALSEAGLRISTLPPVPGAGTWNPPGAPPTRHV